MKRNYDECVTKYSDSFVRVVLDPGYVSRIQNFVTELVEAKSKEDHHKIDSNKEVKRFTTGFLGEAALEKLFGIPIIDWTIGYSGLYHIPDIPGYRVGIKAAIGLMGTALSKDNLQSLRYFGCEIRLCLDLDSPGQLNMQKISDLFDESGIQYKMVNNNVNFGEKDTDEILKNHGDLGLKEYLANLLSKGEWLFNYYQKKLDLNTLDGKKRFILNLLPSGSIKYVLSKFFVE